MRHRPDRTLDSESSFGGLARVLPQTCVCRPSCPPSCSNVGTTAQSVTPPKSNSHRNPQSLARGARSTSRGTVLPNQAIGVYGKTGLTDMDSCCRCTASVRGLAVIVNIGARAPCQRTYKRTRLRTKIQILAKPPWCDRSHCAWEPPLRMYSSTLGSKFVGVPFSRAAHHDEYSLLLVFGSCLCEHIPSFFGKN